MNLPRFLTFDESCDELDLDARESSLAFLESVARMRWPHSSLTRENVVVCYELHIDVAVEV